MKPAPFRYLRPGSVEEVIDCLATHGPDAKILAGGQSLVPAMNFRLAQPSVLVDVNGIEALSYIRSGEGRVSIGAMTRQSDVERSDHVAAALPLVAETMPWVAHPQIRNRGTVGGSIVHADPAAELPAVMVALDATFRLRGPGGERTVEAGRFFTGLFATDLAPEEMLVEVEIPILPGAGSAFAEVARRHGDYALVGAAVSVALDGQGRCSRARVVLLGAADRPLACGAARRLEGETPSAELIKQVAEEAATRDVDPSGDIHASAAYRRHLVRYLVKEAVQRAFNRAANPDGAANPSEP